MNDLHDRFRHWIALGGRDELARDIAIHASGCASCLRGAAALDALSVIDLGAAPPPPAGSVGSAVAGPRTDGILRIGSGVAALMVIVVAAAVAFGPRNSQAPTEIGGPADGSPPEAVLGGQLDRTPEPSPSPEASTTIALSPSIRRSADPVGSFAAYSPTGAPQFFAPPVGTPRPVSTATPRPPAVTADPTPTASPTSPLPASVTPTPTPATPSPDPTAPPTVSPTPTPAPTPTPESTPQLDDCEDGIDNDGDDLIDESDPGCLLDGNEASA